MSQTADDMMDGACCFRCFTYFTGTNGYPVLCKACWQKAVKAGDVDLSFPGGMTKSDGGQPSLHPEVKP